MRFKMTDEIHKKVWMYSIIVAVGILLYFALYRFQQLASFFSSFFSLLMPFILGFAIAFILNGPMMFFEAKLFGRLRCSKQVKRNLSALLSLVLFIAIVCFLLALLIPQLVESIASLVKSFPGYAADFQVFAIDFMKEHDINVETNRICNFRFTANGKADISIRQHAFKCTAWNYIRIVYDDG